MTSHSDQVSFLFTWVREVTPVMLPPAPIRVTDHVTIVDPALWLTRLQQEAAIPNHARKLTGALQKDLEFLHAIVSGNDFA